MVGETCPFLGLPDDPASHYSFADGAHRCWARRKPEKIDLAYQGGTCLSGEHVRCPRFVAATRSPRATVHADSQGQKQAVVGGGTGGVRRLAWIAFVATCTLIAAGFVFWAAGYLGRAPEAGGSGVPVAETTPSMTGDTLPTEAPATTVVEPTLMLTLFPSTPRPSTSPSPTALPTPTATRVLGPTATPIVYVVQLGDTLREIANRFGVSMADLIAANDIADPDRVRAGRRLIIPAQ